jgi:DNA-binding transcriptional LysR family regulator
LQSQLFVRLTRRIELTAQGMAYYREIRQAFEKISDAGSNLRGRKARSVLSVAVLPGVAALWLMPRLDAFWRDNKNIEVRIVVAAEAADFRRAQIDMAIQVGVLPGTQAKGLPLKNRMTLDWNGLQADHLFPDALVAVGHERLLRKHAVSMRCRCRPRCKAMASHWCRRCWQTASILSRNCSVYSMVRHRAPGNTICSRHPATTKNRQSGNFANGCWQRHGSYRPRHDDGALFSRPQGEKQFRHTRECR